MHPSHSILKYIYKKINKIKQNTRQWSTPIFTAYLLTWMNLRSYLRVQIISLLNVYWNLQTWLTPSNERSYVPQNFQIMAKSGQGRSRAGAAILLLVNIDYTNQYDLADLMSDGPECEVIKTYLPTHSGRKKTVLCEIYRQSKLPIQRFLEQLQFLFGEVSKEGASIYIVTISDHILTLWNQRIPRKIREDSSVYAVTTDNHFMAALRDNYAFISSIQSIHSQV